jgi:hypothetical protein
VRKLADEMLSGSPAPGTALRARVLAAAEEELAAERGSLLLGLCHSRLFWSAVAAILLAFCVLGRWEPRVERAPYPNEHLARARTEAKELAELIGNGEETERMLLGHLLALRTGPARPALPPSDLEDLRWQ